MNKNIETNSPGIESTHTESIATIETLDLDNVTGGCAACGCSSPTAAPAQARPAGLHRCSAIASAAECPLLDGHPPGRELVGRLCARLSVTVRVTRSGANPT